MRGRRQALSIQYASVHFACQLLDRRGAQEGCAGDVRRGCQSVVQRTRRWTGSISWPTIFWVRDLKQYSDNS